MRLKGITALLVIQAVILLPAFASASMHLPGKDHTRNVSEIPMTAHEHNETGRPGPGHECDHKTEICRHLHSSIMLDEKCRMKCSHEKTCEIKNAPPAASHILLWHAQLQFIVSEDIRIAYYTNASFLSEPFVKLENRTYAPPKPPPLSIKALS